MRILQLLVLSSLCLGFHVYTDKVIWLIDKSEPTLWIRNCREPAVEKNDLPDGDPLNGAGTLTYTQVLSSVIDDYNNIPTSYIRLAIYPADPANPGSPLPGDSTFTETKSVTRTIDICFAKQVLTGGHASPDFEYEPKAHVRNCKIQINESQTASAKTLVGVLVHEIGHCLGLKHVQESTKSVMSYFSPARRLQDDDKMGITYLYPEDPSYAEEAATWGLSCQTR